MSGHKEPNPSSGGVKRPKPPPPPPPISQHSTRREEQARILAESFREIAQAAREMGKAVDTLMKQLRLSIMRGLKARQERFKREAAAKMVRAAMDNHEWVSQEDWHAAIKSGRSTGPS